MGRKHHKMRKSRRPVEKAPALFQKETQAGLLFSEQLELAIKDCRARVKVIAADCLARNRKFRDVEFDLERDRDRCLRGLVPHSEVYNASNAQRVTQIFKKPKFYIDGTDPSDIIQGPLGDCWFLSALATMSTTEGLVENFCVERNEEVGVYGFIFFRDANWVVVIIDDFLYTAVPKFEELTDEERKLYHNNKTVYDDTARRHGKNLHFAKSAATGETWVPLIEKAYAKLHGNYAALDRGDAGEAIEDLTGGVTSLISTKDILSPNDFWKNELLQAHKGRLFGCSFDTLERHSSGTRYSTHNGLHGGHAYSVLRAVEYNNKRFVVLRNPWGNSEWTGPWSDGSKEWTAKWLPALEKLNHSFGDDGQFIMEYSDFLENWEMIDRTILFDSYWIMSSQWLKVQPRRWLDYGYGDISFTIALTKASSAIIVLSKVNERYFQPLISQSNWSFDFLVFKKGEKQPIAASSPSLARARSVNVELKDLQSGQYVVHVRLDRHESPPPDHESPPPEPIVKQDSNQSLGLSPSRAKAPFSSRVFSRIIAEKIKGQSIALNFDKSLVSEYLSTPIKDLAGKDLTELDFYDEEENPRLSIKIDADAGSSRTTSIREFNGSDGGNSVDEEERERDYSDEQTGPFDPFKNNAIVLGLRVYTHKDSPVKIEGQLRH